MKWILGIILLPMGLWAADPPVDNKTEIVLDNVSGGLATTQPSYKIGKSFSPYMRNVIVDNGRLEKPNGFTFLGSTNTLMGITGIFPHYADDLTVTYLVTDSSVVLKTSDFSFFSFVSSGSNTSVLLRGKQARSNMFFSNGVDSVFEWSGSAKTILDGTKGFPNIPKGKYQEYYQERLWEANLPNNPAQACFSDSKSTNGVLIALDNFLAWPAGNCLNIGQGDGQAITGMWVENGQLQFGKERSIHTLFGTNASSYIPRKRSDIGVASGDSVVMMDNDAHFLGQDGIYRGEQRISDLINPESQSINRDSTKVLQNLWESQPDFLKGQFLAGATNQFFNSTATPSGFLTTFSGDRTFCTKRDPNPLTAELSRLDSSTTFYNMTVFTSTEPFDFLAIYNLKNWKIVSTPSGDTSLAPKLNYIIRNLTTGKETSFIWDANVEAGTEITENFLSPSGASEMINSTNTFTGNDLTFSSIAIKVVLTNWSTTTVTYTDVSQSNIRASTLKVVAQSTGQFISDIATMTTVTSWGTFDSVRNTNGGNINYYLRTSTSLVNIATQTWVGIAPGVNITAPVINNFIQWAATMAAISTTTLPNIDNVTINHVEGAGAVNRAFGISWLNRYWLFTSTSSDQNLSFLLMKSRITNPVPDAWMPIEGINIRAVAKDNTNAIYGGASTVAWFYRLDYGTNYNGKPIPSIYRTSEVFMDNPFMEKELFEYYLTADQEPGKTIGITAYINGSSYSNASINVAGVGRTNRVIQNVRGKGKLFFWDFTNSELDKGMGITNFAVNYKLTGVRKGANE